MMDTTSNWRRDQESPKSSLLFAAHARHFEKRLRSRAVSPLTAAPANSFAVLPCYSGGGHVKPAAIVNPFENPPSLANRLKNPACSPDVFANVRSPSQITEFHWTIEDISRINPAKIDSPLCQIDEEVDEQTESQVQEAIQIYFSTTHSIRSPVDGPRSWVSFSCASTPEMCTGQSDAGDSGNDNRGGSGKCPPPEHIHSLQMLRHNRAESTPCGKLAERRLHRPVDVGTQTMLTLPPVLPEEIAAILEPYMKTKDESIIADEVNTSSNTLRRKLFFHNDNEFISPVKCNYLDDNWNLKDRPELRQGWTPTDNGRMEMSSNGAPSTPDISPIKVAESTPPLRGSFTNSTVSSLADRLKVAENEEEEGRRISAGDFTRDMDVDSSNQAMMSYIVNSSGSPGSPIEADGRCSSPTLPRPIFSSTIVSGSEGRDNQMGVFDDTAIFTSTRVISNGESTNNGRMGPRTYSSFTPSWSDTGYHTIEGGGSSRCPEESPTSPAIRKNAVLKKKCYGSIIS